MFKEPVMICKNKSACELRSVTSWLSFYWSLFTGLTVYIPWSNIVYSGRHAFMHAHTHTHTELYMLIPAHTQCFSAHTLIFTSKHTYKDRINPMFMRSDVQNTYFTTESVTFIFKLHVLMLNSLWQKMPTVQFLSLYLFNGAQFTLITEWQDCTIWNQYLNKLNKVAHKLF